MPDRSVPSGVATLSMCHCSPRRVGLLEGAGAVETPSVVPSVVVPSVVVPSVVVPSVVWPLLFPLPLFSFLLFGLDFAPSVRPTGPASRTASSARKDAERSATELPAATLNTATPASPAGRAKVALCRAASA